MQTRLTFDKPITAIVGPNGSGKSNIADAVMWVMGEQSVKTLRGGKMEDVIFGGTQRRPQQNFAEVSLIFDNSDGVFDLDTNEVMITRRYYRTSESEYYINQSLVPRKDVLELLMDTGLGREGYSVIGQGRISEILSVKSKDRREIFEEAAGISRYRHRKDETEKKLSQTEDNLVRIGDRISELELQIEPLREQAEVAKRFNHLSTELQDVEISLWLKELETINIRTEKVVNDHRWAVREADAAGQELTDVYAEQDTLAEMTQTSDIEAQTVRERISEIENQKSDVQREIAVSKSQLESNIGQIENINNTLAEHKDQHDNVGNQISDYESKLEGIKRTNDELNNQITLLDEELNSIVSTSESSNKALNDLAANEQQLDTDYNNKKSELSAFAAGAQEMIDAQELLKQKQAEAKSQLKAFEEEHRKGNEELEEAREELISQENIIKGLALKVESRTKKAEESGAALERLSSEYQAMQARQTLLTNIEKEYQGYSGSVRMIMQEHARGALRNIHGTVGSLVKTDESYTVAVETALGGAMQHIIVDTKEDAKAVSKLLKNRNAGRATCQPISAVKGNRLNPSEFRNDDGFIGLAIDLVEFDDKYSGIYTYLLGRVVICEDIASAISMSNRHNNRYKIVSLDGQVMNPGGSMTVGSADRNVGMLSRANELALLGKRIVNCKAALDKAEHEHAERVREKNAIVYEHDTTGEQLRRAEENVRLLEQAKEHREQKLESMSEILAALVSEHDSIEGRINQNTTDTELLKTQIASLEKQLADIGEKIEKAIAGNNHLQTERERITSERSEIRAKISANDAEKEAMHESLSNLKNIAAEMSGSWQNQLKRIKELESDNERIRAEILDNERSSQDLIAKAEAQQKKLSEINARKLEVEAKRNGISDIIKAKNEKHLELQRKVSELNSKKELIEGEEKHIIDTLLDKYNYSRHTAEKYHTPVENVSAAKKRINALKREIDDLGPVNTGAISEFERVNARYLDWTTQRDDVEDAKAKLLVELEKIISNMREIFSREFNLINENFKRTFTELFGGGRAELVLEDPEDVLNCGIEIEAQPPGKALSTITLLSGGEQAFVAIAIYFAILAVRPPPFVIMDEIDAALDDANVVRFSDYMRYMSDKTQMIVITHKRGTMEGVDVIYGITMQELGVSNLIPLDFSEAEKHIKDKVSV